MNRPSTKPSLAAALHEASGKTAASTPARIKPVPAATPARTSTVAPSRAGKKIVSGHFDPAVTRQLKQLALDRETTVQGILSEALNDLFAKYGKQKIA